MKVERFEDLEIWQLARGLCRNVNAVTCRGPFGKDFKFRGQIRDSSGSVMDCIAEGFERDGTKEFIQFLSIAKGSCGETRSQIYRAFDFEYIDKEEYDDLIGRTIMLSRKISSLMTYLKTSGIRGRKFL